MLRQRRSGLHLHQRARAGVRFQKSTSGNNCVATATRRSAFDFPTCTLVRAYSPVSSQPTTSQNICEQHNGVGRESRPGVVKSTKVLVISALAEASASCIQLRTPYALRSQRMPRTRDPCWARHRRRRRHFLNGAFTDYFERLELRHNDKPELVKAVLRG